MTCRRRVMFCCSQTHYNGGCYFRLTARLQYPPQPIRERRETNEEQKLTITPQNFMPCTQSFSCAIIIIAAVWVPACDTLSPAPCYLWSELCIVWDQACLLCEQASRRGFAFINARNWTKSDIFFFCFSHPSRRSAVRMDSVSRSMSPQ